jgi:hypothetical protein
MGALFSCVSLCAHFLCPCSCGRICHPFSPSFPPFPSTRAQLRYLEVLSLRNNQFGNIKTLAIVLDALPALRIVNLAGNRAMADSSARVELLQHMTRNGKKKCVRLRGSSVCARVCVRGSYSRS